MSVGDTHVLHFLGRSQFYIILTFSEKGEFICVSVNCKAVIKYPIRTCKLGRNSIIIRPHILKIGSADSSDTWATCLRLLSRVSAPSFFPHWLHVRPGFGIPERRQAGIPCCSLPASLQLSALHPGLFFSAAASSLQVTLGAWKAQKERLVGRACSFTERAFLGRPLAVASHGAQQPAAREGCTCPTAALSTHRCRA